MNNYIATFFTQFAAFQSHKKLEKAGIKAKLRPVPRSLSSSCGTCIEYDAETPCEEYMASDLEQLLVKKADGTYELLIENE